MLSRNDFLSLSSEWICESPEGIWFTFPSNSALETPIFHNNIHVVPVTHSNTYDRRSVTLLTQDMLTVWFRLNKVIDSRSWISRILKKHHNECTNKYYVKLSNMISYGVWKCQADIYKVVKEAIREIDTQPPTVCSHLKFNTIKC